MIDLGIGVRGLIGADPDHVAVLPAGSPTRSGGHRRSWWPALRARLEDMGGSPWPAQAGRPGVIAPMGGCDAVTLLGARNLRQHLATADGTGMRAVAAPMRSRGWFDLARIDPAFIAAAAAATDDIERGFSRSLLVTCEEVGVADPRRGPHNDRAARSGDGRGRVAGTDRRVKVVAANRSRPSGSTWPAAAHTRPRWPSPWVTGAACVHRRGAARPGELRARYERWPPDGRPGPGLAQLGDPAARDAELVGTVQATVGPDRRRVVSRAGLGRRDPWQGRGVAPRPPRPGGWLRAHGSDRVVAHVHPNHLGSQGVARSIGLEPTDSVVDGETEWVDVQPLGGIASPEESS